MTPTSITLPQPSQLRIAWSDGTQRDYAAVEIQKACPCAGCRKKSESPPPPMTELQMITPAEAAPLAIEGARPMGNYAYAFRFNHGCSRGIYRFDLLYELGTAVVGDD